jgi:hypothetical protein
VRVLDRQYANRRTNQAVTGPSVPGGHICRINSAWSSADTAVLAVDEQADATNKRIIDVLGIQDTRPESERGDEEDDDSERAILKCQVRGKKPGGRSA